MRKLIFGVALLGLVFGCDAVKETAEAQKTSSERGQAMAAETHTSEIKSNLNQLGAGAMRYFVSEQASQDGLRVTSRRYPIVRREACTDARPSGSPWRELGFSAQTNGVTYCYESDRKGTTFEAWAETEASVFCVKGDASGNVGLVLPCD